MAFPDNVRELHLPNLIAFCADIPPQLIAIMCPNINVQELTVKALVAQDRQYIYHAATLDPHTGAELDLEQIWQMVDDLLDAHGDWLPESLKSSV